MEIKENYPLKDLTSFKIGGPAKYFVEVTSKHTPSSANAESTPLNRGDLEVRQQLIDAFEFAKEKDMAVLVLGGGSNILVSDEGFDGLVIHVNNKGFEQVAKQRETSRLHKSRNNAKKDDSILIKVGAGEVWDDVVERAVEKGLWGIENLSLIPGQTGAAPVQNIGAYGQEIASTIDSVEVFDRNSGEFKVLNNAECGFAYRKSIFNSSEKHKYVILNISLKLAREGKPTIIYPDVKGYFYEQANDSPSLEQMRQAIISIRRRKHYDPSVVGNAGSFFKNPYLTVNEYSLLESKIKENFGPEEVGKLRSLKDKFRSERGIKIPAAYLIDICGLKHESSGGAQVSDKQPLVIINKEGKAQASEVMSVFRQMRTGVYEKTGIKLANEPTPVGFDKKIIDQYFQLS
jgi:UDP-N-acetylmuramate dehydrogenase